MLFKIVIKFLVNLFIFIIVNEFLYLPRSLLLQLKPKLASVFFYIDLTPGVSISFSFANFWNLDNMYVKGLSKYFNDLYKHTLRCSLFHNVLSPYTLPYSTFILRKWGEGVQKKPTWIWKLFLIVSRLNWSV